MSMHDEWSLNGTKAGVELAKEAILEKMFVNVGVAFMASAPKEKGGGGRLVPPVGQ